ncbi:MAG: Gfo/Idh/MocA family oxidoreductase [Lentisphaerae bacterium]|nr:Gfo/Idh/MocA family oxidoreductase [Lentisphaerota bacterium]
MRRVCIVGAGGRGTSSFAAPILKDFAGRLELAGIFDVNPLRCQASLKILGRDDIPVFDDFYAMLERQRPDAVVVASRDDTHAEYVLACLQRNIAVYSEKPLCTRRSDCLAIREAAAKSQAESYVTHNMRFGPDMAQIKRLLLDGAIGDILHIQFTETLDRFHGADYFRRWHRFFKNTGSLLIHKASHHFDLVNWFAGSEPQRAAGQGRLAFYGKNGPYRGKRCSGCQYAGQCEFYADVFATENSRLLYKEAESFDGYFRDGCVFDEAIDIPDTYAASISYQNQVIANYSLLAYAQYESMRIAIEGSKGRLEYDKYYGTSWAVGHKKTEDQSSLANDGEDEDDSRSMRLFTDKGNKVEKIPEVKVEGGHGGADPAMREAIFCGMPEGDPLGQRAALEEGIQAVLLGISVMDSISAGGSLIDVQSGEKL